MARGYGEAVIMLLFLYFAFTSTFIYKLYTLEGAHFRCVLCPDAGEESFE